MTARVVEIARPLTPIVGRDAEIRGALRAVCAHRLVTLVGVGGIGKTRFATELLHRIADGSREADADADAIGDGPTFDAAWFCELASATSVDDVRETVSRTLDVARGASRQGDVEAAILHALASHELPLLVLDNLEQLVEVGIRDLLRTWLQRVSQLTLLVTSRRRLRIPGEHTIALSPLPTATHDATEPPALELFMARAREADSAWPSTPGPEVHEAAAAIVRRLEGIPLALELAAAQLDLVDIHGLRERLESRLDLTAPMGSGDAHHSSLRAVFSSSWALLSERAKRALTALSVFRRRFPIEAAESVLAAEDESWRAALRELLDASLVRRHATGEGGRELSLFVAIREFAEHQLAATPARAKKARDAHLRWCARRARRAVVRADPLRDLDGMGTDFAVAIEHGLRTGASTAARAWAVDVLSGAHRLAVARGTVERFERALERAATALGVEQDCNAPESPSHRRAAAEVLRMRGSLRLIQSRLEEARTDIDRAMALAPDRASDLAGEGTVGPVSDPASGLAEPTAVLRSRLFALRARLRGLRGDAESAISDFERALEDLPAADAPMLHARLLSSYGAMLHELGRGEGAVMRTREALEMARAHGERTFEGIILNNLALMHQERGEFDRAASRLEAALAIHHEVGHPRFVAIALGDLGGLRLEDGRAAEARGLLERAIEGLDRVGDERVAMLASSTLTVCLATLDMLQAAERQLDDARGRLASIHNGADALCVEHAAAHVRLATARAAQVDGDDGALDEALVSARDVLAHGLDDPPTDEVRFAARLLDAAIERSAAVRESLHLASDGAWFRMPDGDETSLENRTQLARVLASLVEHRKDAPGESLSVSELHARAWEGEQALPEAMTNRVRVAISTLRKLGLREVLLTRDGGYLLDPAVPLTVRQRSVVELG